MLGYAIANSSYNARIMGVIQALDNVIFLPVVVAKPRLWQLIHQDLGW